MFVSTHRAVCQECLVEHFPSAFRRNIVTTCILPGNSCGASEVREDCHSKVKNDMLPIQMSPPEWEPPLKTDLLLVNKGAPNPGTLCNSLKGLPGGFHSLLAPKFFLCFSKYCN